MDERKIALFVLFVIIYCLYSVQMWFTSDSALTENTNTQIAESVKEELKLEPAEVAINNNTGFKEIKVLTRKTKYIPLYFKNACSILQVFTEKPPGKCRERIKNMDASANTLTVIGIMIFLIILTINAVLDVLKVKEEEKARKKLYPDGERRQSLAEFANKKTLRRESSRFSFQLFQISESSTSSEKENKSTRQTRPYKRGDSINSYLSERKIKNETSAPASIADSSEPKLVKRQSVAKLFGARPAPMVRRSSFPALPLNPDVQAAMLGHRQPSLDSDEEKGHRVRILRRF